MANYPKELAQEAACQSHTGCLTGLWYLPKLAQGLNTNTNTNTTTTTTTTTNNNNNNNNNIFCVPEYFLN